MTNLSKRLASLVSFFNDKDRVVDVGCDHGYLSLYLKENNLVESIIASDVNENALNVAKENIKESGLDIPTVLSDGIDNVDITGINCLVMSGMGTATVLHILEDSNKLKQINKIIVQSNNNHDILRKQMNKKGYYLSEEIAVYDRGKWYLSMLFIKSGKKNTDLELEYGLLNNRDYVRFLIDKYTRINNRIPDLEDREEKKKKIYHLKEILREKS